MHINKNSKGYSEQRTSTAKICVNGKPHRIYTPWIADAMRFRPRIRRVDIERVVARAQNDRRLFFA